MSNYFITLDEANAHLKIDLLADDKDVQSYINIVESIFLDYLGYSDDLAAIPPTILNNNSIKGAGLLYLSLIFDNETEKLSKYSNKGGNGFNQSLPDFITIILAPWRKEIVVC